MRSKPGTALGRAIQMPHETRSAAARCAEHHGDSWKVFSAFLTRDAHRRANQPAITSHACGDVLVLRCGCDALQRRPTLAAGSEAGNWCGGEALSRACYQPGFMQRVRSTTTRSGDQALQSRHLGPHEPSRFYTEMHVLECGRARYASAFRVLRVSARGRRPAGSAGR